MKKILLILLIFALCLVGCQPTDNGDDLLPNEENGEASKDEQADENLEKDEGDNNKISTSLKVGTTEWEINKKPPIHPITNANDPQDESADFLYVFNVKYGEF